MARSRAQMIEATRAKLLDAARRAFREAGYAATSMDDFTAAAGLTRGALYHHFGGKPGLLAAVVEQIDDEMDRRLDEISARAGRLDRFRERCRAYLRMAAEPEIRHRAAGCARRAGPGHRPCPAALPGVAGRALAAPDGRQGPSNPRRPRRLPG